MAIRTDSHSSAILKDNHPVAFDKAHVEPVRRAQTLDAQDVSTE